MEHEDAPYIANDLLNDSSALRQLMDEDGYLFFRGLFDCDAVAQLRRQVLGLCHAGGLLLEGRPVEQAQARARSEISDAVLEEVMHKLYGLEALHHLFHAPAITDLAQKLIGEPVVPHALKLIRIQFPSEANKPAQTTAPHQDFVYNQGSSEVYTCWVPLGDVPRELGGLRVLRGSHKYGVLAINASPAGSITYSATAPDPDEIWISPDYQMGDAIVFHSLTLHGAPANRTRSLRISMDCRYQGISQPFSPEVLVPLPGVEEAYPQWQSHELQYYWRNLNLKTVPHDWSVWEQIDPGGQKRPPRAPKPGVQTD